ncbi:MAG: polysulfide reductase NrfD [Actinobacteria bacterium]|nr:polysulfide reductase NrfD [Actinomycetota bacterium]
MARKYYFARIEGKTPKYYWTVGILGALVLGWLVASYIRFVEGMYLTGMSHSVPWAGCKVLFVLFVGLSAGSFILSALAAIFKQKEYKVLSRVGGYVAILFMLGALAILLTDEGRPDRVLLLFVPGNINPRSMLSLNAFIYTSYITCGILYLWAQLREKEKVATALGIVATVLAVGVHSGTGFLFSIANGREAFFTPITPIAFVVAALSSGTGIAMIILYTTFKLTKRTIDMKFFIQLRRILTGLIFFVIYLMTIEHLTHLYVPEHQEAEFYIFGGGFFTWAFWGGLIGIGGLIPIILLLNPATRDKMKWILTASALHVFGVLCERMIIVLPGQFLPQPIMPGYEIGSAFRDGVITNYLPSVAEWTQIVGVIALVALLYILGLRMLPLLPVEGKYIKE